MGINRIVMHNGVVWWLPPLEPRLERRSPPPGDGSTPPGFIPFSQPEDPGIDALLRGRAGRPADAPREPAGDGDGRADGGEGPPEGTGPGRRGR